MECPVCKEEMRGQANKYFCEKCNIHYEIKYFCEKCGNEPELVPG